MFELSIEQIKMVSGGATDQSGNNYGDSSSSKKEVAHGQVIGAATGTAIAMRLGLGPVGTAVLAISGTYIGNDIENSPIIKEAMQMYQKTQEVNRQMGIILP